MRGVPPGGKIQLLHMAAEEEGNEWREPVVEGFFVCLFFSGMSMQFTLF